jgi:hypothetical protein
VIVVVDPDVHVSTAVTIGEGTGRFSSAIGVPGGTLTENVICLPFWSVTTTWHGSAAATLGTHARANMAPPVAIAVLSLRFRNMLPSSRLSTTRGNLRHNNEEVVPI